LADETQNFRTVARVGDVPDRGGIPIEVADRMIALFLNGDEYFAIDDVCPHQGMPLNDGLVEGKTVTCTWHGWRFSLEDGSWLDSPRIRVGTYPVRIVGDEIQVAVD
jgi:nitrite reductase (NADH) small subunit